MEKKVMNFATFQSVKSAIVVRCLKIKRVKQKKNKYVQNLMVLVRWNTFFVFDVQKHYLVGVFVFLSAFVTSNREKLPAKPLQWKRKHVKMLWTAPPLQMSRFIFDLSVALAAVVFVGWPLESKKHKKQALRRNFSNA